MSSFGAGTGKQVPFGTGIGSSPCGSLPILRGLTVILALLVVGSGCEAGQESPSGARAAAVTDTVVVFYVTFKSSYSYTRLGRVDDPARLAEALGPGSVRVVFSKD